MPRIITFTSLNQQLRFDVVLEDNMIWFTLFDLANNLLNEKISIVSSDVGTIFSENWLDESTVSRTFTFQNADGSPFSDTYYNLDLLSTIRRIIPEQVYEFECWALSHITSFQDALNRDLIDVALLIFSQQEEPSQDDSNALVLYFISKMHDTKAAVTHYNAQAANLNLTREGAMDDRRVRQAKQHFEETVRPYFQSSFTSVEEIEKEIRAFILEEIPLQDNLALEQFISANYDALVKGEENAMKGIAPLLTSHHPSEAAFRGYNRFCPTHENPAAGKWPNLLTPTENDKEVFSTPASHLGKATEAEASRVVREWSAFYFLALKDVLSSTEDKETRSAITRNYLTQLADIRNAHGRDNPSCFPGHFTRLANTAHYHPVARLPNTLLEKMEQYFLAKESTLLKTKLAELRSVSDKEDLLNSLIDLTENTLVDVTSDLEIFPAYLLRLRRDFIRQLGSARAILEDIRANHFPLIQDSDIVLIEQYLADPARGCIAGGLSHALSLHLDSKPSEDDFTQANPFDPESPEFKVFEALFRAVIDTLPIYQHSLRRLNNLKQYLNGSAARLVGFDRNQTLEEIDVIVDSFDSEEETDLRNVVIQKLSLLPGFDLLTSPRTLLPLFELMQVQSSNSNDMPAAPAPQRPPTPPMQ